MLGKAAPPNEDASLPFQVDTDRPETDRAALSQDDATGKPARVLWTGLGFTVLMLIGVSTSALLPLASHVSARSSRLVPEVASFYHSLPVLHPGGSGARTAGLRAAVLTGLPGADRSATVRRAFPPRMDFGDSFYEGWDKWAAEYPQIDRDTYPELFKLPEKCYEVILNKPLGIAFESGEDGGVVVDYLVDGGNAANDGTIQPGDVLIATTAAFSIDIKFERKLIPSRYEDFDTIMSAIASNEPKVHKKRKNDVILQFARPGAPYENDGDPYEGGKRGINDYIKSLEFPPDSPWRRNR